jgi:hypothetical protein
MAFLLSFVEPPLQRNARRSVVPVSSDCCPVSTGRIGPRLFSKEVPRSAARKTRALHRNITEGQV